MANPFGISPYQINVPTTTPSIEQGISNVVIIFALLIGMASIVAIVYGALMLAGSAGDPKRVKQGRDAIFYACVGIVVAVSAFAIVTFVLQFVK